MNNDKAEMERVLRRKIAGLLKIIGGGACLGIGLKMMTLFEQPLILPFFPNVLDWLSLILVGVYLAVEGYRTGRAK